MWRICSIANAIVKVALKPKILGVTSEFLKLYWAAKKDDFERKQESFATYESILNLPWPRLLFWLRLIFSKKHSYTKNMTNKVVVFYL